eukprot:3184169-Pleurochrysis_carterae.AAC.1
MRSTPRYFRAIRHRLQCFRPHNSASQPVPSFECAAARLCSINRENCKRCAAPQRQHLYLARCEARSGCWRGQLSSDNQRCTRRTQ